MSKLFVSKRTRAAAWVILLVLPALMVAFGYYHSHRPAVNPVGSRTFWDYIILNSDILLGLLFLLLTMLSDTVYYGLSHDAAKRFTPFEMTYVMFVVGMAVFIPVALIQAGGISSELITAPAQSGSFWLAVLYLGILSSGVAYGLLNFANSHLTVSESSLFSNVTTVVSVLAGVLFLKEDFSLWQALGVVIILVCVFVANVSGGEKK